MLILCVISYIFFRDSRGIAIDATVQKARSICLAVESAREQKQAEWQNGAVTKEQVSEWFKEPGHRSKALASIPVVTAWNTAKIKADEGEYDFRVPALNPRNPENTPNAFEARALKLLRSQNLDEYSAVNPDTNAVHYFRPVRLSKDCLLCHGDPANSLALWGNNDGLDGAGYPMEGWEAGDMHGAFEVIQSLNRADSMVWGILKKTSLVALLSLAGLGAAAYFVVGSVSQRLSSSRTEISNAVTMVSDNVAQVATASHQLESSISEISNNAAEAAGMSTNAVQEAENTMKAIESLVDSSSEIGKVVTMINEISEQTNLLALNATIEAARAGESGRGFSVVANEVKELAKQTGGATQHIANSLNSIREDGSTANSSVEKINEIIRQVSEAQQSIAGAVQEQSAVTTEINRNMTQVSEGGSAIEAKVESVFNSI